MTPIPFISGEAALRGFRIALWIAVIYVVVIGLQACATSKPTSRSKFDSPPQHDHFEKRHRRWN